MDYFQRFDQISNTINFTKVERDVNLLLRLRKITPGLAYQKKNDSKRIKKGKHVISLS